MLNHEVTVWPSAERYDRSEQLAWNLAEVATDPSPLDETAVDMVINRVIDNAAVAAASIARQAPSAARQQAQQHPPSRGGAGANVFGLPLTERVSPEWAAWANGVAVRELDFHDTFLAADYSHPADNIPAILAVAQHLAEREQITGEQLVRGILTGYEIQVNLVKGICLHEHKIDHVAHLGPSAAAGIGTLLGLSTKTVFQAIGQALHTTTATRQSRKGEISSWKAFAPALAGKVAVESVDRAMRGETSPTPIYEGEDGVIAWLLDGKDASYTVPLPVEGEPKRAILDTYTKEHSAEYQAQAFIDLARKLHHEHPEVTVAENVERVVISTSHHTHFVIGSGANDPQKYDPEATRETLDHSIPYIFAVALQDGTWHHEHSYARERATRPDTIDLWQKIFTVEDSEWTRRYHSLDLDEKAFGGAVEIVMNDGSVIRDEIAVADAHPLGARPFARAQYVEKFRTLAHGVLDDEEIDRFLLVAERLPELRPDELAGLSVTAGHETLGSVLRTSGIF